MKEYSFEKLASWQHARKLAAWIYVVTQKFPSEEKFGLTSQMRRAAVSIASNLAEGTSRTTVKDQFHFSTISYSSTIELLNDLIQRNLMTLCLPIVPENDIFLLCCCRICLCRCLCACLGGCSCCIPRCRFRCSRCVGCASSQ